MKRNFRKHYLLIAIAAVFLFGLTAHFAVAQTVTGSGNGNPTTNPATLSTAAQNTDFFSCAILSGGDVATCGVYTVSAVVNAIIGLLVALGAFLVRLALQLNENVFNSPSVTMGFSISLSIANLGFVIGIIIIGIATILRSQTYGIKQLLWKLVVMAIFVNFGLVIARPIVSFADGMTNYFISASVGGSAGSTLNFDGFVGNITAAFAPQSVTQPGNQAQIVSNAINNGCSFVNNFAPLGGLLDLLGGSNICNQLATQATGQQPNNEDAFDQALMSLIFGIIMTSVTAMALLGLAVLLLVRYVYLGILLILLPLAWLTWIFPKFSSNFSKWWDTFIKWTFFPPLAVFFIYLAILTASPRTTTGAAYITQAGSLAPGSTASSNAVAGISKITGQSVQSTPANGTNPGGPGLVQTITDETLIVCLMVGGLFAASSLSGKAGNVVVGAAKSATSYVGGYANKQRRKVNSAIIQSAPVKKVKEDLQGGRMRFLPKRLQTAAGLYLGKAERAGGTDLVKNEGEYAKNLIHEDPEAAKRVIENGFGIRGGVSKERGLAIVQAMHDEDNGKMIQEMVSEGRQINGKPVEAFLRDEKLFNTYGRGELRKKAQEKALLTDDVTDAKDDVTAAKAGGAGPALVAAEKRLADAMEAVLKKTKNAEAAAGYMKSDSELSEMVNKLVKNGMSTTNALKARASFEDMRSAVTKSAGTAFTGQSFSNFMGKFERNDQLDEYLTRISSIVKPAVASGTSPDVFFNEQVQQWMNNNGARNLGLTRARFGL